MKHPDLKKYADEVNAMQDLPPASIELPPLAAIAIIGHIQLASHHPSLVNDRFTKIAINAARQLQELFNQESATCQVIELGWDANEDIPINSGDENLDEVDARNSLRSEFAAMISSVQLSLFDTAAIETTYKIGDQVKLKRKTPHAACLKKGDIVQIEAIHPHDGSCEFWNELTESWGYLYPDEFVLLPPDRIDSPTPAEVAVGASNCPHGETNTTTQVKAVGESNRPPDRIDSPTPAEVAVGESICSPDPDDVSR
ncbi:MAG: hypothetical protein WCD53_15325 [Microcoleus sp.]